MFACMQYEWDFCLDGSFSSTFTNMEIEYHMCMFVCEYLVLYLVEAVSSSEFDRHGRHPTDPFTS